MPCAHPTDGSAPRGLVAVVGTGTIGAAMCRNLAAAGLAVRAWNRTTSRAQELEPAGVTACPTPSAAVEGARWVITALTDGEVVEEAMASTLSAMRTDATWIQASTVGIAATADLHALARRHRIAFVDAPVLGTKEPAERGELVVLAAGEERLEPECRPVLAPIAASVRWISSEPGAATRLKLVVNSWVLALTEAAAEAVAFAEALGLDPRLFLDTVAGSPTDAPYLQLKGAAILNRQLEPSFRLDLARKDIALVMDAAAEAGVELGLPAAIRNRFDRAVELGHGDDDMAAAYFAAGAVRAG